ncbi:MAG TPA: hypothetical protein VK760_02185, partial [Candidatus Acidoferrales bacterium]|nr:hypothetical protein [Candidatus Acidoferrales bacterium]
EAVAAVAYFIRKLLGRRCAGDGGAEAMTGNSLEHLADLAAKVEPGAAATIHQLTGAGVSESLQLLRLRAAVEQGTAIGDEAYANHPGVPRAVVARFVAFAGTMNGRPSGDATIAADATTRYSPAVRFELEYLAFLRARQRGFVLEMQTIAASLRRLAGERGSALPLALQCQADASLRAGDVADAHVNLDLAGRLTFSRSDLRQFAAATMLQSKIALYENETRRAEDLANGAYAVLNRNHRDAYACAVLVSQARWQRGAPWRPSLDASRLPRASWDRIAVDTEHARHLAREGRRKRAARLAAQAFAFASAAGFEGLAARAAGVMYGIAAVGSRREEALRWRADAVARLLRTQDRLLCAGLLASAEPLATDERLVDAMYRRLCVFVPQMLGDDERQRAAVRRLLECALSALNDSETEASMRAAAEAAHASDSAFAHYCGQGAAGIAEILSLTGAAVRNAPAAETRARSARIAQSVLDLAGRHENRAFAIKT